MNSKLKKYILENMDRDTVIAFPSDEEKICNIREDSKERKSIFKKCESIECIGALPKMEASEALSLDETYVKDMSLDDYINNHLNEYSNFQKLLFKLIDDRGLKDSEVYNKVNMSRKTFSKIRNENYHPSKETVILLGLSLELTLDEMIELLDSASYTLARNNAYDLIIRYAFHSEIYDVFEVNEMLEEYNEKTLN